MSRNTGSIRAREFVIWFFALAVLIVLIGSLLPNSRVVIHDLYNRLRVGLGWAWSFALLSFVLAGPFILGMATRLVIIPWMDGRMKDEYMHQWQKNVLGLWWGVVTAVIWAMLMPIIGRNGHIAYLFNSIGWRTSWEVAPWNWAGYALITHWLGYAVPVLWRI
ncbi:hypothetical protein KJ605_02540 [Patescibacteria group bacterium]|nr:hypothetical protein [Patescibacteria group bacterium]